MVREITTGILGQKKKMKKIINKIFEFTYSKGYIDSKIRITDLT